MTRGRKTLFGLAIAAIVWLFLLILFSDNGGLELLRIREAHQQLAIANQQLLQDNVALYRMVDRLHTDPVYIEEVARKELGLVRPDELIFTFAADKKDRRP